MNPMKLLVVSKSIRNVQDRPSRYRMRRENLLPKFSVANSGSVGVPATEQGQFSAEGIGLKADAEAEVEKMPPPPPAVSALADWAVATAPPVEAVSAEALPSAPTGRAPESAPSATSDRPSPAIAPPTAPAGHGWAFLRKAWGYLATLAGKSAAKKGQAPVQAEWDWKVIRVARNDLSDSDCEVVVTAPASEEPQPNAPASARSAAGGRLLRRVTARMLGAGKT
jgi:hypothetical protein